MRTSTIICKIIHNKNNTWELKAVQEEKSTTIAIKESFEDAKELAFALHSFNKVDAIEYKGDFLAI